MAASYGLGLKRPSAIPGFGLALGFTLTYLSLIVLIPLAALVLKSATLGLTGFWEVVTGPRTLAALRLSFLTSLFAATVNAVANVAPVYIDNARTFGAGRFFLYRTVILPAILPEMHSAVLLALGAAWAAVLGAEFLGAQSGLGYIIVYSQAFGFLDRMFLIALLVVLYASVSYWLANRLFQRLNRWSHAAT